MSNPPSYLTLSEKERWSYAQGNTGFTELSRKLNDLEDEIADEIADLEAENGRLYRDIDELEAELETFNT